MGGKVSVVSDQQKKEINELVGLFNSNVSQSTEEMYEILKNIGDV